MEGNRAHQPKRHTHAGAMPDAPGRKINHAPAKWVAVEIASYILAGIALWLILVLKLLGGLLAGLFTFQLIHALTPLLEKRLSSQRARWLSVMLLSILVTGALSAAIVAAISYFQHSAPSEQKLLERTLQIIDGARGQLPVWLQNYLPDDIEDIRVGALEWLRAHISELRQGGKNVVLGFVRIALGIILGAIVAVSVTRRVYRLPFAAAMVARISHFSDAVKRIVFAQVKISLINASLTSIYLLLALPLFQINLPLGKTLVLLTFVVGLLPVVGNLISNTVIIVVSLSAAGATVAFASLIFLVVIHKLEYFLNARIIGIEIEARTWELLLAMLVMEAGFGLPGVVAAPIYYAYLKYELSAAKLI